MILGIKSLYRFWKIPFLRFLDVLIWRTPEKCWPPYLRTRALLAKTKVGFGYSDPAALFYAEGDGKRIYVSHPRRMWLYLGGVNHRLTGLVDSYCLFGLTVPERSVVIDVGANAGELGIFFGNRVEYIGFEPDPTAYRALKKNLPKARSFQKALSDQDGRAKIIIATATADTHLERDEGQIVVDSIEVDVLTLDSAVNSLGIDSIFLMKVEAEGHEPEVLGGATATLKKAEYVALDCGPERDGRDTATECLKVLYSAGFEVVDTKMLSGRVLLRRKPEQVGDS